MTHAFQFTEQDWERIGDDWTAWWAGPYWLLKIQFLLDYLKNSA